MNSLRELILYYVIKLFAVFVRLLPLHVALCLGRVLGWVVCFLDVKHLRQVEQNLKVAFSATKSPEEITGIARDVFVNFGQNIIELLRLPLLKKDSYEKIVAIDGRQYVQDALKLGRGVILLAMHSGSWELANFGSAMLGGTYKVMVNPQSRFSRIDRLLNTYRECGGAVILERGAGTKTLIRSLQNNEIVAMVVDQGGRNGALIPFFCRRASLSVGAVRIALKSDVPVCFAVIRREAGPRHRLIIYPPFQFEKTGDGARDVQSGLEQVARLMESHIRSSPSEFMWFYKIWKFSPDVDALILNDGRTGHLRQSQSVARLLEKSLALKEKVCRTHTVDVAYRSRLRFRLLAVLIAVAPGLCRHFRRPLLKSVLTPESYRAVFSAKGDYIISCGSVSAYSNYLLAAEQQARSVAVLKPGVLGLKRFDCVLLPEHDRKWDAVYEENVIFTKGAPNLITPQYLQENMDALRKRFSHLKTGDNFRIGVLLGGDTKDHVWTEKQANILLHQLKEIAEEINADILLTTSRRTSAKIENLVHRQLKRFPRCRLLILANRENVAEAVGGILGLADLAIVSGDSISMISEAASSGRKTIVFPVQRRFSMTGQEHKHNRFIDILNENGYVLSTDIKHLKPSVYAVIKNKIQLRPLDDNAVITTGLKRIL